MCLNPQRGCNCGPFLKDYICFPSTLQQHGQEGRGTRGKYPSRGSLLGGGGGKSGGGTGVRARRGTSLLGNTGSRGRCGRPCGESGLTLTWEREMKEEWLRKGSARRLVQGSVQADGELIRYWPPVAGGEREEGMNGILLGAPTASSAGKDLPPSDRSPNGMLSAQAHDFPAVSPRDPKWGRGWEATALRQDRSYDPEFVSNPSESRAREETVRNSQFKGIRLLWLPRCLGHRLQELST